MSNKTYINPWAGLSSYQDPESADVQLKFCGRDNESFDVAQLIDDNIFVTLYGKSGTGKTSLLNAGVFPRLRQEQYLPVSIRLGMDAYNISFQQCILTKIAQALQGKGSQTTIDVVLMPDDEQTTEYLWSYFARTRFTAPDGSTLFPILVFDQFEEVFRNRRAEAETLLRQIHFMTDENHALSDRMVNGQPYQYDFNFRFVVSIREDDLYRLEDSIDNCYLPELKHCRYRLRSLTEQGANDVILIPGEGLFKTEEQRDIVNKIISKSRNEDGSISTNIISLLCSRIFTYHSSLSTREAYISPTLVDSFLKGNPFEKFYNEATRGFSNREKSYIEEHLVDSTGRRNSLPESDFLLHVKNGAILLDGERKILQRTSTSSDGGNYRVELIHDSFCEPLAIQKEKREKQKRRRQMSIIAAIAILSISVVAFVLLQINRASKANWGMMENQSRAVAEKIHSMVNDDSYLAKLLALEILPKDLDNPDRPYVLEAEVALREAYAHENAIIKGGMGGVAFSPDNKHIIAYTDSNTIKVWDVNTGNEVRTIKAHSGRITSLAYSHDGQQIVSASCDKTIKIWNANNGNLIRTLKDTDSVRIAVISRDKQRIVSGSFDKTIKIWDAKTGKAVHTLVGHTDRIQAVAYSPDEKFIASASFDNTIKIWNAETGKEIRTLKGHSDRVESIAFCPNGNTLASVADDGLLFIWDTNKWEKVTSKKLSSESGDCVAYSNDGRFLLTCFYENGSKLQLWDTNNMKEVSAFDDKDIVCYIAFSQDGGKIAYTTEYDKELKILNTSKGYTQFLIKNLREFSIDGTYALSVSGDTLKLWDVFSRQNILSCTDLRRNAWFSSDGKRIATPLKDGSIKEWDIRNKKCLHIYHGLPEYESLLFFSLDYYKACFVTEDDEVFLWDIKKGEVLTKLRKIDTYDYNNEDYLIAALSPNGEQLVVCRTKNGGDDDYIYIFDTKNGHLTRSLKIPHWGIFSVSYNHDGTKILTSCVSERTVRIWDGKTLTCSQKLIHSDLVVSAGFYNNDQYIISVSDGLRIWDVASGKCLGFYKGIGIGTNYFQRKNYAYMPKGKIVGSNNDTVSIIDFPPLQQLIDETRERFKDRPLTKEERRKYYLE